MATALPLLALAWVGRERLSIDVENQAMKSQDTAIALAEARRDEQFGDAPRLFLLARPIAPELLDASDLRAIDAWQRELAAHPDCASLDSLPAPHAGERCLVLTMPPGADGRYAAGCERLLLDADETLPATYRLARAGLPVVETAIARELDAERRRILPLIVIGLAAVLWLFYRDGRAVAAVLATPLLGAFLIEGIQGLAGFGIDPISALLGPAVLTVGVASSVHLLERYRSLRGAGVPPRKASREAARRLRAPMGLTVATTVAGFLGLLTSPIPAVTRFAWLASTGVLLAVCGAWVYLPPLLRLLQPAAPRPRAPGQDATVRQAEMLHRRGGPLLLATAALLILGLVQMQDQEADNDPLQVLAAEHRVRRDNQVLVEELGGCEVFALLLPPGGAPGAFSEAGLLATVSGLDGVIGPADRPQHSAAGDTLLRFLLAPSGSAARSQLFADAEAAARSAGWPDAVATGLSVRIARDSLALIHAQAEGILFTLAALGLVMAIGFRSIWLGALGLLPNLVPLVAIQGGMAALGVPLSVASSMIAVAMLGLVVDDTIHLIHAFVRATGSRRERVAQALALVQRPIVVTTTVLCVGFAATGLGRLQPTREFGWLAVATLVLALLADLTLLPALLMRRRLAVPQPLAESDSCPPPQTSTS